MAKVFISYNRQSEAVARSLSADVEALGHTVWLDQELSGGQVWWEQILETIRQCDIFVIVLDPHSLNSTACQREYGYAGDLGKPVLPVLAADGISTNLLPPVLSQIQFVDYRQKDRDAVLKLARAFTAVPASKPLPNPLPPPPDVPLSYLGNVTARVDKAGMLTYEEQSTLIVDLRRAARDQETRDDALVLLRRLRKRRDLLAQVADEIDEVLREAIGPPEPRRIPEPAPPPLASRTAPVPAPAPPSEHGVAPLVDRRRPPGISSNRRLVSAAIAAAIGASLAAIAVATVGTYATQREGPAIVGLYGALPWAIAGAVAAGRASIVKSALILALAGFVVVFALTAPDSEAFLVATVLGGSPGLLLGAIVGLIWIRRKRSAAIPTTA